MVKVRQILDRARAISHHLISCPVRAHWRKSTYSGGNGSCAEVAHLGMAIAVRDTKDPSGPALVIKPIDWLNSTRKITGDQ